MKNKNSFSRLILFVALLLMISQVSVAQDRWGLEFRPSVNFPTSDLDDATLKTGFGYEVVLAYRFMPHLSVYGGWGWNRFGSSNASFAGTNMDFEETGYTYGLQFIHPIGQSKVNFLTRIGGLANHIEVEDDDGEIIADSGHGFGWQVEGGVALPLGEKWNLTPSIRYRSLPRDFEMGTTTTEVKLNYLSVGVGIVRKF